MTNVTIKWFEHWLSSREEGYTFQDDYVYQAFGEKDLLDRPEYKDVIHDRFTEWCKRKGYGVSYHDLMNFQVHLYKLQR